MIFISLLHSPTAFAQKPGEAESQSNTYTIKTIADTSTIIKAVSIGKQLQFVQPDSALAILEKAVRQSKEAGFPRGIILASIPLGNLYSDKGMYSEALSLYRDAIYNCKLSEQGRSYLPVFYNGIACIYQYMDNYEEAAKYLYMAVVATKHPAKEFSIGGVYNNFALMMLGRKQSKQALYYLDKAEQSVTTDTSQKLLLGGILLNKGVLYMDNGDWKNAQFYFNAALILGEKYNYTSVAKTALINLGNIAATRQKPQEALSYFLRAKAIKGVNPMYENAGTAMLGQCYYTLHNYKLGAYYLQSALLEAQQLKLNNNLIHIYNILYQLYTDKKDYRSALKYHELYSDLKDSLENNENTKNLNQLEIKYRTSEKDKELMQKQLRISEQANFLKRKNIWIAIIISIALLLSVTLLSLYRANINKQHLQAKQIQILQQEQKIGQFKAVMQGEEKERSRIARELHDGLGGMLAAVKMNFSALQNRYEKSTAPNGLMNTEDFDELYNMLDEVSSEIRKTAHNLMPDILLRHGIEDALSMYIETANGDPQLYINLQINGTLNNLDSFIQLSLYRIIQELVQNIIKHASASNALVHITRKDDQVTLLVKDNGKGFKTDSTTAKGLGLQNVRFRVHSLNGQIAIVSSESTGTSVTIECHISNENSQTS